MNAEIDKNKKIDINYRVRHIIQLTRNWIKKPFNLDPVEETLTFQAIVHPTKGKGEKVTVPTFPAQIVVMPEMACRDDRDVWQFRENKGKYKGKREFPKQVDPKSEEPPKEAVQELEN